MIQIKKVIGVGNTKLSAFDNALFEAGIENRNLLYLSSVIPTGEKVKVLKDNEKVKLNGKWGDKLFVVMANEVAGAGEVASASITHAFDEATKNGLFVEHEAIGSGSLKQVETDNVQAIIDLFKTRSLMIEGTDVQSITTGTVGTGFKCAMVVAVFEEQSWELLGK